MKPELDDLLPESARLARRLSRDHCRLEPESGETCAWYHGFLPYLRLMGLVATPAHHGEFFASALAASVRPGGHPRLLVSGAADHYMLAQACSGGRAHGIEPLPTVVDLCETPLALNRWYATQAGIAIETVQADILDYDRPGAFDIVCTHSLLGRFTAAQRPALMSSWRRLLASGGRVITVNRVRVDADEGKVGFNRGHSAALRDVVLDRAASFAGRIDLAPETLADMADAYSARHKVHPIRSPDEIRGLFEDAGFVVERLEVLRTGKSADRPVSGPTMLDGSHYACIVARSP